jgi:glutaryl-CoA dehydrogenase
MPRFTGVDFYEIDSLLQEDEIQIRDHVRDWVEERYLPLVEKAYEDACFPAEVIPEVAEMGLLGATLPEEYGCAGVNATAYGLAMQELERGDSGLRSFASVQGSLAMWPIYEYGSEEQRKRWLPPMAKGEVIGCFGLTEPDFGSNPSGMITRAVRKGGGYVLNGAKMWITNGTIADVAVVWAKLKEESTGREEIRGFLVEKGAKGFSAPEQKRKHSLRASAKARCCPTCAGSRGRSAACRRRASASPSAWSARRWPASTPPPSTARAASSSTGRSAASSSCRRSSPTC